MTKKQLVLGFVALLVIVAFLYGTYLLINKPQVTYYPEVNKVSSSDHIKWSPAKKIILVEYSDFQCPACKLFHDYIRQELETTKDPKIQEIVKKITFVFRSFPLTNIHPHSLKAAKAAEAAGRQNKFYQMADLLFANQDQWAQSDQPQGLFLAYAKELKLDADQFQKDLSSSSIQAKIQSDIRSGEKAQLTATPTFYLQGNKVSVTSFAEFKQLLLDTLAKSP